MRRVRFTRALLIAAGLFCLLGSDIAGQQKGSNLRGYWEGSVTREGKFWRVNFEITRVGAGESFRAVADFIDAGGIDRVFTVEYDAPHVRLERPQPGGAPIVFDGSVKGNTISGKFSGVGTTAEFTLRRRGEVKPRFYREEAVAFDNGDVKLSGTLLLPLGKTASDLRVRLYAAGRMLLENDPRAAEERGKISAELEKYRDAPWLEAAALPPNLDDDKPTRGGLELLFFEPLPVWEGLRVPALFVWGDKDTVVPVEKGREIIESARRRSGAGDYAIKVFPNVTHTLIISRPQGAGWDFPRVANDYLDATAEWLAARVNASTRRKAASNR
ncbi:MAG TPA: hypothetical protein VM936_02440 [Pyrinomonadaceae bacterium]|nr:hypothetical protein [Pyrinomonadaceae bacterium]